MSERNRLAAAIERQRKLEQGLANSLDLAELAEEEGDTATGDEVQRELERIKEQLDRLQLESMLSGEADQNDAFLQVAAGAGGTESQDWAEMLRRMYLRWAEQHGYKTEWIEESEGEEAGIKSPPSRSWARTPMAGSRPKPACIVWSKSRPSTAMRGGTRASPRSRSRR